jgi:alkaline phosphatase D
MLGPAQKRWLFGRLAASKATFKVLASPVPWAKGTKGGSKDTWDGFPEEREEIFSFLEKNRIDGVVLLSADRHRSDAWKIERPGGYPLYEFESSRLTNVHTHGAMRGSLFSYNKKCSFGLLTFDTTRPDPELTYEVVNIDNEVMHTLKLRRSQLSHASRR